MFHRNTIAWHADDLHLARVCITANSALQGRIAKFFRFEPSCGFWILQGGWFSDYTCKVYQLVQGFAPTAVHATSTRWKLLQTDSYHFASNDATFYYDILQWSSMISRMHSTHSANRTSFRLDMSIFTVKWVENLSKTYRVTASHQVLPSYRSLTPRRWKPHHQCNVVGCCRIIKLNLVPSSQDVEAKPIHTMLFFLHFALFRKQERWSKLI